jgi:hypothetical protein
MLCWLSISGPLLARKGQAKASLGSGIRHTLRQCILKMSTGNGERDTLILGNAPGRSSVVARGSSCCRSSLVRSPAGPVVGMGGSCHETTFLYIICMASNEPILALAIVKHGLSLIQLVRNALLARSKVPLSKSRTPQFGGTQIIHKYNACVKSKISPVSELN